MVGAQKPKNPVLHLAFVVSTLPRLKLPEPHPNTHRLNLLYIIIVAQNVALLAVIDCCAQALH